MKVLHRHACAADHHHKDNHVDATNQQNACLKTKHEAAARPLYNVGEVFYYGLFLLFKVNLRTISIRAIRLVFTQFILEELLF